MVHKFEPGMFTIYPRVTLTSKQAEVLANWASVSRTLTAAENFIPTGVHSDMDETAMELEDLTPALDSLHQQVRGRLWAENRIRRDRKDLTEMIKYNHPHGLSIPLHVMSRLPQPTFDRLIDVFVEIRGIINRQGGEV